MRCEVWIFEVELRVLGGGVSLSLERESFGEREFGEDEGEKRGGKRGVGE